MLIKIITLPFNSAHGGFNDAELRDFMKGNEIISVRDHFFMRHDVAYLTLIIKYLPGLQELDVRPKGTKEELASWLEACPRYAQNQVLSAQSGQDPGSLVPFA
jgi:hypothetical protein